ncbi:GH25 family lysozyme [Novosphingobium capsulatum]|uniref:GH25 family lysozyme n=1 Tax=Novosphingobium capsulatum TaxID=13688 RepID=UPI002E0FBC32|nr:GH25 family lysozyme [Novosphingobium capsulatum]WQD93712.1 GH25 family lysozyme [Novosphingobium capsulatum]
MIFFADTASAQPVGDAYAGTCPNGAPAREEKYCKFIEHYNNGESKLPTIVGDFLGIQKADQTRAIGFIIAIDDYPKMPGHNLSAAKADGENLKRFLIEDQHFDEVIVLKNADATAENINYFLEDYLVYHGDDFQVSGEPKARLLIAYSGHGRPQAPDTDAAFVLSSAKDPKDASGVYKMTNFAVDVSSLAGHYFHILTLINACFSANFFPTGNNGVAGAPMGRGSFAITAGSPKNEAVALLPSRGSLFFDLIINGVQNGDADPLSYQYYVASGDGSVKPQNGLTLSLPMYNYLSGAFYKISTVQTKTNPKFIHISAPYFGSVQAGKADGAFFFVSGKPATFTQISMAPYLTPLPAGAVVEAASLDIPVAAAAASPVATPTPAPTPTSAAGTEGSPTTPVVGNVNYTGSLPANLSTDWVYAAAHFSGRDGDMLPDLPMGPLSSIKGRPDLKIFKAPAIYPIKGYDLSSADGAIDWKAFERGFTSEANRMPRPAFIYARALGWKGADGTFDDRWRNAKALGIDRGAYLKLDFCSSAAQQLQNMPAGVLDDVEALPVGIELVTPSDDQVQGRQQRTCYERMGQSGARDLVIEMAGQILTRTHKTPLLMGNSYNLSVLTDTRSERYMIWLNAYGPQNVIGDKLKLGGRNPWTMWQYTAKLNVPGIGANTTGEVFFGTRAQYEAFKRAEVNVALQAVK